LAYYLLVLSSERNFLFREEEMFKKCLGKFSLVLAVFIAANTVANRDGSLIWENKDRKGVAK
jgi:hypothetical protein